MFLLAAVALALVALTAGAAHATLMPSMSIEELAQRSDAIVRGEVLSVTAQRTVKGRIETTVKLRIAAVATGDVLAGTTVEVRSPGGRLDDGTAAIVASAPTFNAGEEVVVFLARSGTNYRVVGMNQGLWRVYAGSEGKRVSRQAHPKPDQATGMRLEQLLGRAKASRSTP